MNDGDKIIFEHLERYLNLIAEIDIKKKRADFLRQVMISRLQDRHEQNTQEEDKNNE